MLYYTSIQLIVLAISFICITALTILIGLLFRHKSEKVRRIPLIIITIMVLTLETSYQVYHIFNGYTFFNLPFWFHNVFIILYLMANLCHKSFKHGANAMIISVSFVFIIMYFLCPNIVIGNAFESFFTNFDSFYMISLYNLIIIYLAFMLVLKIYKPKLYQIKYVIIGICVYFMLALPIGKILEINYTNILYPTVDIFIGIYNTLGYFCYVLTLLLVGLVSSLICFYNYFWFFGDGKKIKLFFIKNKTTSD